MRYDSPASHRHGHAPHRQTSHHLNAADTPLTGPPPPEVPLSDPPLERVIAQVRFPLIASLEKREFIASFQEAIRTSYPVLRPEEGRSVVLGSQGMVDTRSNTLWRFNEAKGAWRVTLAPDFLALETTEYTSRDDFMKRLTLVLEALKEHVDPQVLDRLGVRYIDRVSGENMSALPRLVRPEVAGILGSPLSERARHAVSENVFILPGNAGQITARWGLLAPQSTTDPGALDADQRAQLDPGHRRLPVISGREPAARCRLRGRAGSRLRRTHLRHLPLGGNG